MDIMDHFTCEVSVVYSSVARQELLQELCDELLGLPRCAGSSIVVTAAP